MERNIKFELIVHYKSYTNVYEVKNTIASNFNLKRVKVYTWALHTLF